MGEEQVGVEVDEEVTFEAGVDLKAGAEAFAKEGGVEVGEAVKVVGEEFFTNHHLKMRWTMRT